jgi:hypothetical protein
MKEGKSNNDKLLDVMKIAMENVTMPEMNYDGRFSFPTKDAKPIATWRRTVWTTCGAMSSRLNRRSP